MACIHLWSSAVKVHDSQAYRKIDDKLMVHTRKMWWNPWPNAALSHQYVLIEGWCFQWEVCLTGIMTRRALTKRSGLVWSFFSGYTIHIFSWLYNCQFSGCLCQSMSDKNSLQIVSRISLGMCLCFMRSTPNIRDSTTVNWDGEKSHQKHVDCQVLFWKKHWYLCRWQVCIHYWQWCPDLNHSVAAFSMQNKAETAKATEGSRLSL